MGKRNHGQGSDSRQGGRITRALWAGGFWLLSASLLTGLLYFATPDGALILGSLDVELPGITELTLSAGAWLHADSNLLVLAAALLGSLLPLLIGARGKLATRIYFGMGLLALLATAGCWLALSHPLDILGQQLMDTASPLGR